MPLIAIPESEIEFTMSRSSGPGGQNVNKTESKVTLHWKIGESMAIPETIRERFLQMYPFLINDEGEVVIISQQHRSQHQNREDCIRKLSGYLEHARRPPKRRMKTRPTKSSKEKRLRTKKKHGEKKTLRRSRSD